MPNAHVRRIPTMKSQKPLNELLPALSEKGFSFIRILANDKRPEGRWKNLEDRINADEALSRISNGTNYGIVPPAKCFILDFDSDDAYQRSVQKDACIADSLTFKTPRGFHVLFEGDGIPQGASHTYLGQGVDVRAGERGYVVGPGSTRTDGRYEYRSGDAILEAPDSLRALLQKPSTPPVQESAVSPAASPAKPVAPPVAPSSAQTEGIRSLSIIERGKAARKHWKALDEAQEGERNDTLARAACGLGSIYGDAEPEKRTEIYAKLIEHADRLGDGDAAEIRQNRTTAENQWNEGAKSPATRPDGSESQSENNEPAAFLNICDLMGYRARFNLANQSEEWWIDSESKWRPLIPHESQSLLARIWNEHGWNVKAADRKNLLSFVAEQNRVHPYRDELISYLEYEDAELKNVPIGQSLNWWVSNPEGEYEQWCQTAIWLGIVARIMGDPEHQRTHVTLRGPGGCGKTTLVKHLLPDELGGVGQLNVSGSDRDRIVLLKGRYAVEFPEMAGMSKREAAELKRFFGAGEMQIRILRTTESMTMRYDACIIGTANEGTTMFDDPALIERFAYLDVQRNDGMNPAIQIPKIRKHYLAEALRLYQAGERYHVIPEALKPTLMERAGPSVSTDQGLIDRMAMVDYLNLPKEFTAVEYAQHAGLARNYSEYRKNRLHQTLPPLLRRLGFTSRTGTRGAVWWQRPANGDYPLPKVDVKTEQKKERDSIAYRAYANRNLPEITSVPTITRIKSIG